MLVEAARWGAKRARGGALGQCYIGIGVYMVKKGGLAAILVLIALFGSACGGKGQAGDPTDVRPAPSAVTVENRPKIVAFGDSLTAGYGLSSDESYPALLEQRLRQDGYDYEVVNAGVSGDTSAGGLRRIDWALDGDVKILILELGANDILRGQSIKLMKDNLSQIIEKAKARNVQVLLCGIYAPTSVGPDYQVQVVNAYRSLADEQKVAFMPFFLESVGGIGSLNQGDGIHPGVEGTKIVAGNVYKALAPILKKG
jgi:acyl-CoA thioesterase-1